jgi:starch-binding outer membrane protein, SusD/RagB family
MKTKLNISTVLLAATLTIAGCSKVLDKTNLTAVNPSEVWSNPAIARAYLDNIYANTMPGASYGTGNNTDEGVAYQKQTNGWFRGTATYDSYDIYGDNFSKIRTINILLLNIGTAVFDETSKAYIKGQGLFWRAWCYYSLTKSYGGVPLILAPQGVTSDLDSLQMPRNKTSECVAQIIKDLDDAIALLPDTWSGEDAGRIDKGAAMAFKGRVLLFFASPLFNPSNDQAKWQQAYDANLAAKNFLDGVGKGLYAPYNKIWDDELNKEIVMVKRYNYPQSTYFQGGLIPLDFSKDDVGYDRPSLELADAFPMKDGSSWTAAARSYDTLFRNRDDRFYETIYYNGSPYQYLQGMREANTYLWTYFDEVTDYNSPTGIIGNHNQITPDPLWSNSSFYRIKGVDKTIVKGTVYNAAVDWPEIRYAEVLMNYGEAANELNKTDEALEVLYAVRARAGILPGSGNYGITAASTADLRKVYLNERFVEFAFENKRLDDLRRWKMFDYLRALPQRHGIGIVLKAGQTDVSPKDDINTVWTKFSTTVIPTEFSDIAIKDQYYIYGIPLTYINRNPKLEQNNNWDGTFDPLQ